MSEGDHLLPDSGWLQVTETTERETMEKGGLLYFLEVTILRLLVF